MIQNLTKTTSYRNRQKIVGDVLTITQDANRSGIAVTKLCQKGNLSHSRLRNLLSKLTSSGLINKIECDGRNIFVITEKGRMFLAEYKKFNEFASDFGLEM